MKETSEFSNRRLIRPSLDEVKGQVKGQMSRKKKSVQSHSQKRSSPTQQTNAESFYYAKQMHNQTPMAVVLCDGERLTGTIQWYDGSCLKLGRTEGPNLLIYKSGIKYVYKLESEVCDQADGRVSEELSVGEGDVPEDSELL